MFNGCLFFCIQRMRMLCLFCFLQVKAYKFYNILGNFKLDIQKNHCQLQVSLADTLHSGQTFDLSFHGNDVHTTISEFGQCVERLHKL